MSILYILTGPKGSGKQLWADEFIQSHPNVIIVSVEKIKNDLQTPYYAYTVAVRMTQVFLKYGYDVIFIYTNLTENHRKYLQSVTPADKYICVAFDVCLANCCKNATASEQIIINKQFYEYEFPKEGETYDAVWIIK